MRGRLEVPRENGEIGPEMDSRPVMGSASGNRRCDPDFGQCPEIPLHAVAYHHSATGRIRESPILMPGVEFQSGLHRESRQVRPETATEKISECPESECGQGSLHTFYIQQVIVDEFTHILSVRNV